MFDIDVILKHWFWWAMTVACLVWYSTITIYVAIKGVSNIKDMLRRLADKQNGPGEH